MIVEELRRAVPDCEGDTISPEGDMLIELTVEIKTGRRHQIRSCLTLMGFPVFGDSQYYPLKSYDCNSKDIEEAAIWHAEDQRLKIGLVRGRIENKCRHICEEKSSSRDPELRPKLLKLMDAQRSIQHPIGMWGRNSVL
eukprot:Gregarina_sp_Poly_1__2155@NODE_1571_length_3819_cov_181_526386_g1038_i0_p5_GENE_NODE_1571_length_3819_cov_181_526386_g1038_i0NODE_1571_length_3819_cov_181_526386_g1038_i0_p5_ORF_typecomplete_len139_score21_86PseudoU_synth_2/PF00849_22/0_08_NODE_1571_length_3819_cov_181_526386_g1038_i013221738